MKLKLIQTPNRGQKDMVCHTNFGTFEATVGSVLEVKDEAGHAIMAKWPGCFQQVLDTAKAVAPAKSSTPEEKAEAEAAKMAQGYQNKKAEARI